MRVWWEEVRALKFPLSSKYSYQIILYFLFVEPNDPVGFIFVSNFC